MIEYLLAPTWSPELAGFGIGILTCLTFLLADRALGCSTAYLRAGGLIEWLFRGNRVLEREYFRLFPPVIEWELVFVPGIVIGSFLAATASGTFALEWVPAAWYALAGGSVAIRLAVAFLGGALLGFGARWANGCTSGHGISGSLQLAVSSWVAVAGFFAGGIVVTFLLVRVLGG